ncbi:MAG TPA: SUMF1/EgtB/PvdO family nonheme iron enzyme, partial [bacterium]|nr:SUMF1/EgtB/PvdO family nonheme iron enzyme [bacterium]
MKIILILLFLFINSGIVFTADGKINGNDVKKLNASLLKRSGEIGYDTSADIYPPGSPDRIVDIRDMQLLQRSFGSQIDQGKYNLNADIYHSKPMAVTLSISDSSSNSITLNWSVSNDTDFSKYKIYYSIGVDVDTTSMNSDTITNRSDTDSIIGGLTQNTEYYFRVYVCDSGGNAAASNIVSCATLGGSVIYGVAMVTVNTGTFNMGLAGVAEPVHSVTLTRQYEIGKYEVTNKQYCDMLQYAYDNGWIQANADSAWITRNGACTELIWFAGLYNWNTGAGTEQCRINFGGGIFTVDPGYDSYPVIYVTWFGSALYCNFLSLYEGRQICYDSTTWQY